MKYKKIKWHAILAIFAIITFLLAIIGISQKQTKNITTINDGWYININNSYIQENFNLKEDKFDLLHKDDIIILKKKLPNYNYMDPMLEVYSSYTTIEVFIDDKPIYEFGLEKYLKNEMLLDGIKWIRLNNYQNKELTIKMIVTENKSTSNIKEITIGERSSLLSNFIKEKILSIIVSGFSILLGFLILILFTKFKTVTKETQKIFFICIYSLLIGSWIIASEGLLALIIQDGFIIKFIEYFCLYFTPVPVFGYLIQLTNKETGQPLLSKRIIICLCLIHIIFNIVCILLHILNIVHFKQTLVYYQLLLIITTLSIIMNFFYNLKENPKYSQNILYGAIIMLSTIMIDVLVYNLKIFGTNINSFVLNNASTLGTVFLLFSLIKELYGELLETIKKSSELEMYNRLAFTDILTNLKNRAWYENYIKNLKNKKYTMISIDLNDLKVTNDTKGHDKGDELITIFGNILKEAFDIDAHSIRFGGDEFLVILEYIDNDRMEKAISKMKKKIKEINALKTDVFVSASYGIAYSIENNLNTPTEVYKKADQRMYKMKKRMKIEKQLKSTTCN